MSVRARRYTGHMRKIGDIHVFEDQAFLNAIKRTSMIVLAVGVVVTAMWGLAMTMLRDVFDAPVYPFELDDMFGGLGRALMGLDGEALPNPVWWASLAAACFATLPLHELVHAFFFKQYAPPGTHISFGANAKLGMMYASAEDVIYPRAQYLIIVLAPSFVVTTLVLAIGFGLAWPMWTIIVATAHLSGCTGDWEYARVLHNDTAITHCRDTEWGVEFYGRDRVAHSPRRLASGVRAATAPVTGARPAERSGFTVVDGGKMPVSGAGSPAPEGASSPGGVSSPGGASS